MSDDIDPKALEIVHEVLAGAPRDGDTYAETLARAITALLREREEEIERLKGQVGASGVEVAACHRQLGDYVEAVSLAEERAEAAEAREKGLREVLSELREASRALVESLGEYVRQSMHANPEWRDGVRKIEAILQRIAREALAEKEGGE